MGYERILYLYLLFHYTGEKRFSRELTKNPNANVWAHPEATFWAVIYLPHQVQSSLSYILCLI